MRQAYRIILETSLFVATLAALGTLSPGPDFFLTVRNAARYQRLAAVMIPLGMILGMATHMAYRVAGLAMPITATPWLFNALKYTGMVYLIWIGIQALRSRGGGTLDLAVGGIQRVGHWSAFLQGYLCNLLNPKAMLFFLAMLTRVLSLDSSFAEKLRHAGIIVGLAILWWPLLVVLIQSAVVHHGLARAQGVMDKLLDGLLIALGVKVALS